MYIAKNCSASHMSTGTLHTRTEVDGLNSGEDPPDRSYRKGLKPPLRPPAPRGSHHDREGARN